MKYFMKITMASIFLFASFTCLASKVNIESDKMEKSKDGLETIYSGNVVVSLEGGNSVNISSLKLNANDSGDVYEGDVKISQDSMIITTNKAVVSKKSGSVRIKMDMATISDVK